MVCTYAPFIAHPRIGKIVPLHDLKEGEWGVVVAHFHSDAVGGKRGRWNGEKWEQSNNGSYWRHYKWNVSNTPTIQIKIKGVIGMEGLV